MKKGFFMKAILTIMLIFLLVFTSACLFITYKTGYEPSALIASVFAFCSVEGGLMAWIRTSKNKYIETNNLDD